MGARSLWPNCCCVSFPASCAVIDTDAHGQSIVHRVAKSGNAVLLSQLIDKQPHLINLQDLERLTPLHVACHFSRAECVKVLLSNHHTNPWIVDKFGQPPLAVTKNDEILLLLMSHKTFEVNDRFPKVRVRLVSKGDDGREGTAL